MASHTPVSVVLSSFEDIMALGLRALIDEDPSLQLLASGVTPDELNASLDAHRPRVAIVNYGSLTSPTQLRELSRGFPDKPLLRVLGPQDRTTRRGSQFSLAAGFTDPEESAE